jgi:aminoglycoside phosphotransferase (APT) family kinase protein
MVALVYKIIKSNGEQFILKVCERPNDYFREVYFLKYFADRLPVPRIIQFIEPSESIYGVFLMEYIPGSILKIKDLTSELAYEARALLAQMHLNRVAGYADLIKPNELKSNPIISFTEKFEEGLAECEDHLPKELIKQCKKYYNKHIEALALIADGPCIVHRDYRPGNIIANNDKIQGVIDWSSARAGFAQEDF